VPGAVTVTALNGRRGLPGLPSSVASPRPLKPGLLSVTVAQAGHGSASRGGLSGPGIIIIRAPGITDLTLSTVRPGLECRELNDDVRAPESCPGSLSVERRLLSYMMI
jgi:hypothetical protein